MVSCWPPQHAIHQSGTLNKILRTKWSPVAELYTAIIVCFTAVHSVSRLTAVTKIGLAFTEWAGFINGSCLTRSREFNIHLYCSRYFLDRTHKACAEAGRQLQRRTTSTLLSHDSRTHCHSYYHHHLLWIISSICARSCWNVTLQWILLHLDNVSIASFALQPIDYNIEKKIIYIYVYICNYKFTICNRIHVDLSRCIQFLMIVFFKNFNSIMASDSTKSNYVNSHLWIAINRYTVCGGRCTQICCWRVCHKSESRILVATKILSREQVTVESRSISLISFF